MRTVRWNLPLLLACSLAFIAGCGHKDAAQPAAGDSQKIAQQQRQIAMDREIYQINNSNLPPDQKQRMIDQLRASGPQ